MRDRYPSFRWIVSPAAPHPRTRLIPLVFSRFAQLDLSNTYLPFSHKARAAIHRHIGEDGKLLQVGDIGDERKMRLDSAEGQAFVVLMEAAWRDWYEGRRE